MGHDRAGLRGARTSRSPSLARVLKDTFHLISAQQYPNNITVHMSSPLLDVWEAASASPYNPSVGKGTQFTLGFVLLFICKFANL
jgi:hypothetical protein